MSDELIDIYDEDNHSLGIAHLKSKAHAEGLWHRTAHVWIYNSKGEMLIQLRSKNKILYPDKWDISAAGHVNAGEEPWRAALRETKEELGIRINKGDLEFLKIMKCSSIFGEIHNNEFYYVYLLKLDQDVKRLKPQQEEVHTLKFIKNAELNNDLQEHPEKYVPHGVYWFDIIREVKRKTS